MFERLTHRSKYDIAYTKIAVNESNMVDVEECYTGRIIDRLAAYEDSGLSPEEVVEIKKYLNMWIEICKENNVSIVQFKKWAEAEAEGRLVVLPCRCGDTAFAVQSNEIIECKVKEITIDEKGIRYIRLFSIDDRLANFRYEHFKDTVFLSREAAEKALEVRE